MIEPQIKRRNKGGVERTERLNIYLDGPTKDRLLQASNDESITMNEIVRESVTQRIRDRERYGQDWVIVRSLLDRVEPAKVVAALQAAGAKREKIGGGPSE